MKIRHWLGHQVELAESRGGVLAFSDPWEGVVRGGVTPWPPPELTQKLYQSRQARAFDGAEAEMATRTLGYYSDLQSVHSEDAVTWSAFGPLIHAAPQVRTEFAAELLEYLKIPAQPSATSIWLWRRFPHPDSLVSGGPEIDVGIQTGTTLILGEAKWRSGIGTAQGVARDKDQIQLRSEFCKKYGAKIYPRVTRFIVLGIGQALGALSPGQLAHEDGCLLVREISWETLGGFETVPHAAEFREQLSWRQRYSKP